MRGDGQVYGAHGYSYAGHMYQQPIASNAPFVPSNLETSTVTTREGSNDVSASTVASGNNGPSSGRSGYVEHTAGLHGRGVLPVISSQASSTQDVRIGYEGGRAGVLSWTDFSKTTENQQRHNVSSIGQHTRPLAPLLVSKIDD